MNFISGVGTMLVGVLIIVIFTMLISWFVMMLWNGCLVGAVAGVSEIGWLQAWGISVLTGLLFKTSSSSK